MKVLISIVLSCISLQVLANCSYHLKYESLLYEGYTLNFSDYLEQQLISKGYERSFGDYKLEVVPHFEVGASGHFATVTSSFKMINQSFQVLTHSEATKKCYTQACAVSDAKKVLVSAIRDFARDLKECR
jgi:hypothetical protein